ncbi:hypothetical protein ACFV2U_48310 [Streptomyces sp. NPDC059697]|uniref:hypothetical protein n=1 Tax=Streptomyces sp. NPDC059697 TaxID=3346912 RepID=UPI0036D168BF
MPWRPWTRMIDGLVARAQASGMKLTGEGGLLAELTRRLALEGELTDHLGHEAVERAAGRGGDSPTGSRFGTGRAGEPENA